MKLTVHLYAVPKLKMSEGNSTPSSDVTYTGTNLSEFLKSHFVKRSFVVCSCWQHNIKWLFQCFYIPEVKGRPWHTLSSFVHDRCFGFVFEVVKAVLFDVSEGEVSTDIVLLQEGADAAGYQARAEGPSLL